jgi:phosphoglycolate phosphatase-like HAD superfamily hydrolase
MKGLVVFDLNGTLIDSKSMWIETRYRLLNNLVRLLGVSREQLTKEFRAFLNGNDIIQNLPSVKEYLDTSRPSTELDVIRKLFDDERHNSLKVTSGVPSMLRELKKAGYELAVWTNTRSPFAIDFMLTAGLDNLFDSLHCPARKPGVKSSVDTLRLKHCVLYEHPPKAKKPSSSDMISITRVYGDNLGKTCFLVGNGYDTDGVSTINTQVTFLHSSWVTSSWDLQDKLDNLIKSPEQSLTERAQKSQAQSDAFNQLVGTPSFKSTAALTDFLVRR